MWRSEAERERSLSSREEMVLFNSCILTTMNLFWYLIVGFFSCSSSRQSGETRVERKGEGEEGEEVVESRKGEGTSS